MTGAAINGFLQSETPTFFRVVQTLFPDWELASMKTMDTAKLAETVRMAATMAGPSLSAPNVSAQSGSPI